jgi:hypothetical protein
MLAHAASFHARLLASSAAGQSESLVMQLVGRAYMRADPHPCTCLSLPALCASGFVLAHDQMNCVVACMCFHCVDSGSWWPLWTPRFDLYTLAAVGPRLADILHQVRPVRARSAAANRVHIFLASVVCMLDSPPARGPSPHAPSISPRPCLVDCARRRSNR